MQVIRFETKEEWLKARLNVVTSTEVSCLFDMNPYMTLPELWHQKKNQEILVLENNERLFWGETLEPAIAEGVGKMNGWQVAPFKIFGVDDDIRAGSSFDFIAETGNDVALLEIKNVDWLQIKDKWIFDDGKITEAPFHIELQVQHQLMITGYPACYIAALEGGNKIHLLKRVPQDAVISEIKKRINSFWRSIETDQAPKWDFERDADFISKLYGFAEPGKIMDVPSERIDQLAIEYKEASQAAKEAAEKKDAIKAELLTLIGESEKVLGENYTISAGMVGEAEVSYVRKPYRNFRINYKKEKQQ